MSRPPARPDAIVVGSGPNGLAAAITLARAGWRVIVLEAAPTPGGGLRTAELTLPGFHHDVCAAIHPLGAGSPFFRSLPLERHGLVWCHPELPLAHPLDDGTAAYLHRDLDQTVAALGPDGPAYDRLIRPFVNRADDLVAGALAPLRWPRHPWLLARFGREAIRTADDFARAHFHTDAVRALAAGNAGHATMPFDQRLSAAAGFLLMIAAHAYGWPVARGGTGSLARALVAHLAELGGEVRVNTPVARLADLPPARAVLFDTSPHALARIAGDALPASYRRRLERYRHAPGAFKVDWALRAPIPWTAEPCRRAGTVHVGGTLEEITAAEAAPARGLLHPRPFVLVGQQSLADPTRAPAGRHTGWAYCHVPNGSTVDATALIEAQIERFAPGFRDLILARSVMAPADFERYNSNYVGGDIIGGVQDWAQLFSRPVLRLDPYATPHPALFLCSASTPPGGGVHGLCGFHAAQAVLRSV